MELVRWVVGFFTKTKDFCPLLITEFNSWNYPHAMPKEHEASFCNILNLR
jgi:hypothetical protein